jgi:hypothetical protein
LSKVMLYSAVAAAASGDQVKRRAYVAIIARNFNARALSALGRMG